MDQTIDSRAIAPAAAQATTLSDILPAAGQIAIAILVLFAGIFLALTLTSEIAAEFSAFAFAIGKIAVGVILYVLVDRFLLHFNTAEEIRNGNIAVALFASVWVAGIFALVALC